MPTKIIPIKRVTLVNPQREPPSVAAHMTVDRVYAATCAAEAGNTTELFTLYRDIILADSHVQGELGKRKLAVLGDPLTFQPWDPKAKEDVDSSQALERQLLNARSLFKACIHLLDATLYPVAVVEKVFKPGADRIAPRYSIADLIPVPHTLLDYRSGNIRIFDTDAGGNILSTSQDPDPERYIIHRGHMLSVADNRGGPMRALLYWWLLGNMGRGWWASFLERYGSPFMVGTVPAGDANSRALLESAFAWAIKLGGLVVTDGAKVELKQASSSSGDAFEKFMLFSRREISKLILGQTLSAEAQPTGMNSGVSDAQETVRGDIRRLDARLLGETIRDQLAEQWLRVNGFTGMPPTIIWAKDTSEAAVRFGTLLVTLKDAGFRPTEAAGPNVSEKVGLEVERIPVAAQEVGQPRPFLASWKR